MKRSDAIEKLKYPAYSPDLIDEEFQYIANKLEISNDELRKYFNLPKKFHWDYKNQESMFNIGAKILQFIGLEKSIKR